MNVTPTPEHTTSCNLCRGEVNRNRDCRWWKGGHAITQCATCGLLFRFDPPRADELPGIYGAEYFSRTAGDTGGQGYAEYLEDGEMHRAVARRRVRMINQHGVTAGRVLDVGAAAGFFVAEAKREGWKASGVDVSEDMVNWGRQHLEVSLFHGTFESLNLDDASLDAITMWDYIEHAYDPRSDLLKAARALRPGGVLVLSTGDIGSAVARASGKRWHLLTPRHHNFFFDRQTIRGYLTTSGFEILDARYRWSVYSLAYVTHKLRTLADVAPVRFASDALSKSRFGRLPLPLNLFDILTVTARRR